MQVFSKFFYLTGIKEKVAEKIFEAVKEMEHLATVAGVPDFRKSNPATPTVKLTGNPFTIQKSPDDLDIDVSDSISNGVSIEAAGERIFKEILSVANGKMTFSEIFRASQSTINAAGANY